MHLNLNYLQSPAWRCRQLQQQQQLVLMRRSQRFLTPPRRWQPSSEAAGAAGTSVAAAAAEASVVEVATTEAPTTKRRRRPTRQLGQGQNTRAPSIPTSPPGPGTGAPCTSGGGGGLISVLSQVPVHGKIFLRQKNEGPTSSARSMPSTSTLI